jgi:branched-chain amino acid transport system permease protein
LPSARLAAVRAFAIKLATAAPIVPYLLLVLMLIVRPRGLLGTRDV